MEYKENKYVLTVKGTSGEIKSLIDELSALADDGFASLYLRDKLDSLDNLVELEEFKLGLAHTIKFNRNTLIYSPNCSDTAKKFHYKIFKEFFDEAYGNLKSG